MHITGIFKLGSILIKLLSSTKYLHYIIFECEKDMIKG